MLSSDHGRVDYLWTGVLMNICLLWLQFPTCQFFAGTYEVLLVWLANKKGIVAVSYSLSQPCTPLKLRLLFWVTPCFGPGMQWPQWSGYVYFGTRSTQSNTVAALISAEITDKVVLLENFGDARSLWFHIQVPVRNASSFLLLAIYAPPPNYTPKERLEFFEARLAECHKLRGDPMFSSLPMLLAGDVNLHAAEICEKNRSLERPVDRDIASVITGPLGMNLVLRNPLQTATHDSGSALDLVYSSHNFNPVVQVLAKEKFPLSSDHRPILITQLGSVPQAARPNLGKTKWKPFSDAWNHALLNIPCCLEFICSWINLLLCETFLRDSLICDKWSKLRQAVVDKVVWWRSVVICLAGHMNGLAVTVKPSQLQHGAQQFHMDKFLLEWFGPQCQSNSVEFEEFASELGKSGSPALVRKFLDSYATNPSKAQATLSPFTQPQGCPWNLSHWWSSG